MAEEEGSGGGWVAALGARDAAGTVHALGNQRESGHSVANGTAKTPPSHYKTKPWAWQQCWKLKKIAVLNYASVELVEWWRWEIVWNDKNKPAEKKRVRKLDNSRLFHWLNYLDWITAFIGMQIFNLLIFIFVAWIEKHCVNIRETSLDNFWHIDCKKS